MRRLLERLKRAFSGKNKKPRIFRNIAEENDWDRARQNWADYRKELREKEKK